MNLLRRFPTKTGDLSSLDINPNHRCREAVERLQNILVCFATVCAPLVVADVWLGPALEPARKQLILAQE
jgi:hypothetical protein